MRLNTLPIEQGETYDVAFRADNPGTWLVHCHDLHHASNAGQESGGLIVAVNVRPVAHAGAVADGRYHRAYDGPRVERDARHVRAPTHGEKREARVP